MKVLSAHSGADTGGQASRIKHAFDRLDPTVEFRYATKADGFGYINYPKDLPFRPGGLRPVWEAADVVHLHNDFRSAKLVERKAKEKPQVVHYHGTAFRLDPHSRIAEQRKRKAVGIVSTLDLWLLAPRDVEWLPAPYDLDWLSSLRNHHGDPDTILIAHAPTAREIKSTAAFEAAIDRLRREGYPVASDVIEGATWASCLARKARADIYFDQSILGYGCNAIEAWGMGIPVVAGGADPTLDEMERRFGSLPFLHATVDTIYDALRELVESKSLREQYAALGLSHVQRFHDDAKVIAQLKRHYSDAINRHTMRRAA